MIKAHSVKGGSNSKAHCGNLLSLGFYVKSVLENREVLKLSFWANLGALNFVDLVNCSLQKVLKIKNQKSKSLNVSKLDDFETLNSLLFHVKSE